MTDIFPPKHFPPARTFFFSKLQRLFRLAAASEDLDAPVNEIVAMCNEAALTRRRFIQITGGAALAVAGGQFLTACRTWRSIGDAGPRIIIVGAGVAGLHAAYVLKKAGLRAIVYEASGRTGGRMYTGHNLMGPGLTVELGGEFIDSTHEDMLALAKEFGLPLIDVRDASEAALIGETYYFKGRRYTEAQAVEAIRPFLRRLRADKKKVSDADGIAQHAGLAAMDRTTMAEYLQNLFGTGWIRDLLDVAYAGEYGLDVDQQSMLNFLALIPDEIVGGKFELFGDSDERFKILGGNQRIVDELAKRVEGQIRLEHKLEAIRDNGNGFTLNFQRPGGSAEVKADVVILALPFTTLREVDIRVDLPPVKKKAIAELGYGTNAKIMAGYKKRFWRERGHAGTAYTDKGFQLAWDNSRLQPADGAGVTFFLGGRAGLASGEGTPLSQANRFIPMYENIFPEAAGGFNGQAHRFHWPSHPFTKGSYSCYTPGQWTTIGGTEGEPVGNLFFAGEHCSPDFAGFMNGGAQSGRLVAEAVLALKGGRQAVPS